MKKIKEKIKEIAPYFPYILGFLVANILMLLASVMLKDMCWHIVGLQKIVTGVIGVLFWNLFLFAITNSVYEYNKKSGAIGYLLQFIFIGIELYVQTI